MSLYNTIILGSLFLFFPNLPYLLLNEVSYVGNMGLSGVYLDIINKRNNVYFLGSFILLNNFLGLSILFNNFNIRAHSVNNFLILFFLFSIGIYFYTIYKWCFVITMYR